jgi:GTP-binding protein Era
MQYKSGFIAIIGFPNAGKSTLLNQLLDFKLSIISPKPQTTRRNIIGIMNRADAQVIFIDTPGILTPRYLLQEKMVQAIHRSIEDADGIIFIMDAAKIYTEKILPDEDLNVFTAFNHKQRPAIAALNKIDLVPKEALLPVMKHLAQRYAFEAIVPLSAQSADGLEELVKEIMGIIPEHPPFYDTEVLTEHPERFLVAELIREQIFFQYDQEIPYGTEVQIETFREKNVGKDYIQAIIYTENPSHKAILIGRGGDALKKIGRKARREIELLLGRKIYLELYVKVNKNWRKNERSIKEFGY